MMYARGVDFLDLVEEPSALEAPPTTRRTDALLTLLRKGVRRTRWGIKRCFAVRHQVGCGPRPR
jgi:hypothetical protein